MIRIFTLFLVWVFSFSSLQAKDDHLIGLKLGLTSIENEDGWNFEKSSFFVDFTPNASMAIKPRIDLGYISIDDRVNSLLQFSLNGVYDIDLNSRLTPYLLGGFGYEKVSGEVENFKSHPYLQAGFGLRYPFLKNISLVGEFRALKILGDGDDNEDNEFALMFGVSVPLFVKVQRETKPKILKPKPKILKRSNEIIIENPEPAFLDSDSDGVEDILDKCKHTPAGESVDSHGCMSSNTIVLPDKVSYIENDVVSPAVTPAVFPSFKNEQPVVATPKQISTAKESRKNLKVNFESSSATILTNSKQRIRNFATYLKDNPNKKVTIEGYTDNSGIRNKNFALSTKRAKAVRELLISYGVKATRIKAIGKGDLNPIEDNDTEVGRANNRRIEALIK